MTGTDEALAGMSEDERKAFHKGYDDYREGQKRQGAMSLTQPSARPTGGV